MCLMILQLNEELKSDCIMMMSRYHSRWPASTTVAGSPVLVFHKINA